MGRKIAATPLCEADDDAYARARAGDERHTGACNQTCADGPRKQGENAMTISTTFFRLSALCLAWLPFAGDALAQDYPTRAVHWIVSYPPGGGTDIVARIVGQWLSERLKQQFIIENKPGAGNNLGTEAAIRAAPDGYTLFLTNPANAINATLYQKLNFNFIRDTVPVGGFIRVPNVMEVHPGVPAKTVAEFIAYGKANPGKLNYASAGGGSATHLSMAYFANLAGLEMVHIPFKATGEAVNEVVAGRAHAAMPSNISALSFTKEPRVRLLAVTGPKRSKFLPELPTVAESLPGYEFDSWIGLLAPAATPKATVEQINAAMARLLQDPAMLERLDKQGVVPRALKPEAFNALLRDDFEKMGRVVKAAGARID